MSDINRSWISGLAVDVTPLRVSRGFRMLWIGEIFTLSGRHILTVAVPLQVFQLTESSLMVGLVSLAQVIPLLAGSLGGGVVADAVDRRRLILVTQVILALTSVGLALNAGLNRPALWPIVLLATIQAGVSGIDSPARRAALPRIVGKAHLAAALALQKILSNLGKLAGPALGGLLIASVDMAAAYWVHAATFLAAIVAVAALPALPPEGGGRKIGFSSMREGLSYLGGNRTLQSMFVIDINAMVFGLPRALFPVIGTTVLGGDAATVGLLYSAPGAGALAGALTSGWVGRVRRQGRAVTFSVFVWGAAIIGFGLSRSLPLALAFLALAGAADTISSVFRNTVLHLGTPDALRGRLASVHQAAVAGGPRVGDAESGLVASLTNPTISVVSGGVACILGGALIARRYPEMGTAVLEGDELRSAPT